MKKSLPRLQRTCQEVLEHHSPCATNSGRVLVISIYPSVILAAFIWDLAPRQFHSPLTARFYFLAGKRNCMIMVTGPFVLFSS
ncbi:MAG TPA: hypothetical protein VKR53_03240 [Puia sp.]|nr:hypothetical protein [Puia sp.]